MPGNAFAAAWIRYFIKQEEALVTDYDEESWKEAHTKAKERKTSTRSWSDPWSPDFVDVHDSLLHRQFGRLTSLWISAVLREETDE